MAIDIRRRLWDLINSAWLKMSVREQRLWESVRIDPVKWSQSPYGDLGGGFWAVGVIGRIVVWYNDIEDGFNCSHYSSYGQIGEYWCNQDDLDISVRKLLGRIDDGYDLAPFVGPPRPGPYPG
ncbi:hypothetical protein [Dongia sp.]|uniref:hypothetical protein n=1 Tax=Dongia sp. TaxID=1977262 RepID=UPI003750D755